MTSVNLEPQTLPKELQTLAKKLAAKKKATAPWAIGIAFLRQLPGWSVQEFIGALPIKKDNNLDAMFRRNGIFRGISDDFSSYSWTWNGPAGKGLTHFLAMVKDGVVNRDYGFVSEVQRRVKVTGRAPENPEEGVFYAERCEVKDSLDRWGGTYIERNLYFGQCWFGVRAATVTAADGASVVIYDEPKAQGEFGTASFYKWGDAHGLYEAAGRIGEALKPTQEQEDRERLGGSLVNTGICSICQRRQKLHHVKTGTPLMYDHGYQIPWEDLQRGYATRYGSCFGVGRPPWEISPVGAMQYLDMQKQQMPRLADALAKQKVATRIERRRMETTWKNHRRVSEEVTDVYTPEHPEWSRQLAKAVQDIEQVIAMTKKEIEYYTSKVDGWKRTDTYDEVQAGERLYSTYAPPKKSGDANALLGAAKRRLAMLDDDDD